MSVAEKSAFPNSAKSFCNFHSVVPLGVMGIPLAATASVSAAAGDLPTVLNITISIIVTLVAMHVLQPSRFSVFPSLLLPGTLRGQVSKVIASFGRSVAREAPPRSHSSVLCPDRHSIPQYPSQNDAEPGPGENLLLRLVAGPAVLCFPKPQCNAHPLPGRFTKNAAMLSCSEISPGIGTLSEGTMSQERPVL